MKPLKGKKVVITGAASGIGSLLARCFAGEKAKCALIDRDKRRLMECEDRLRELDADLDIYICDLSEREEVESCSKKILDDFGEIDILVNNAGVVSGGALTELDYEEIKNTLDVNLLGAIWLTRQFLPAMMERGSGHIVNIASSAGLQGVPRLTDYCASKFGLVGFSDTLRLELKAMGLKEIKVSCICPSYIGTGMFEGAKAPHLSSMENPEVAAMKIFDAIKKQKPYLLMPWSAHLIPLVKLLPTEVSDWIAGVFGVSSSMNDFAGSSKKKDKKR